MNKTRHSFYVPRENTMNTHLLLLACLVETLEIICAKDQCKMTVKNMKFTTIGSAAEKQQSWASEVSFWRKENERELKKRLRNAQKWTSASSWGGYEQ